MSHHCTPQRNEQALESGSRAQEDQKGDHPPRSPTPARDATSPAPKPLRPATPSDYPEDPRTMALSQSSMQPPRQHSLILEREIPQITRRTNRSQFSFHHPSPMSVPEPIDVYDTDSRHDKTPHNLFNVSSSLLSALARAHRQFSPTGSLTRQTKAPHASSASRLLSNPSFDLIDLSFSTSPSFPLFSARCCVFVRAGRLSRCTTKQNIRNPARFSRFASKEER